MTDVPETEYIATLHMDHANVVRRKPEIEQERQVAMGDLLRANQFAPKDCAAGPYDVALAIADNRMVFTLSSERLNGEPHVVHLPVTPFRTIVKDYFLICESYFDALKTADPYKVEAVDMGRRGIHNEGSEMLKKLMAEKVTMDFDTARRLFTLMCVLHIR